MSNVYNAAKHKLLLVRHTVALLAVRVTLYLALRTLYVALGLAWSSSARQTRP